MCSDWPFAIHVQSCFGNSTEYFQRIAEVLNTDVFPDHKMHEFYTVNVDDIMRRFKHGIEGINACLLRFYTVYKT